MAAANATGDRRKFGLSLPEAADFMDERFVAYEVQNGANSLEDFETFFAELDIIQNALEAVNER